MINGAESKESVIIGTQLKRARELLQLAPEEVGREINVTPQDIIDWEGEKAKPQLRQLEGLA